VLETVTAVLELANRPMPTREIHTRACELIGRPLLRSSVKGILSAYTLGGDHRFRRVRHGVYELDTPKTPPVQSKAVGVPARLAEPAAAALARRASADGGANAVRARR
jgi:hypothetical protein